MLVPPLVGLNLEMTLASRLSTQVNIGKINDRRTALSAILGNLAIIELQSIIIGLLASFLATFFEYIYSGDFPPLDMLITVASSVATASLASLVLGNTLNLLFLAIVIIKSKINSHTDINSI
jgi:solute carrier family 41